METEETKKTGDQNVMSGRISAGGISIQGSNAQVNIVQNNGVSENDTAALFKKLYQQIEARPVDPNVDKEELIHALQNIEGELDKDEAEINQTKLGRWMDSLAHMAPDILDVALASLGGPVTGVTAILKKIADHAQHQSRR